MKDDIEYLKNEMKPYKKPKIPKIVNLEVTEEEVKKEYDNMRINPLFSGIPRNPDRIDIIIEKLRELWKKKPDQRLGQLICNLTDLNEEEKHEMMKEDMGDLNKFEKMLNELSARRESRTYNIEDNILEDKIDEWLNKHE